MRETAWRFERESLDKWKEGTDDDGCGDDGGGDGCGGDGCGDDSGGDGGVWC